MRLFNIKAQELKNMAKNNNIEMPALFDATALQTGSDKIDVVKMNFAGVKSLSWQELFAGFDTLHAITFSSGVQFVFRLLEMFQKTEIIGLAAKFRRFGEGYSVVFALYGWI